MSQSLDTIQAELEELGHDTYRFTTNVTGKQVVAFRYVVDVGPLQGEIYEIGFSMQQEGYPTYAPHWIHIHPPLAKTVQGQHDEIDEKGRLWIALSRPPSPEVWDEIAVKNMQTYLSEHVRAFWANI